MNWEAQRYIDLTVTIASCPQIVNKFNRLDYNLHAIRATDGLPAWVSFFINYTNILKLITKNISKKLYICWKLQWHFLRARSEKPPINWPGCTWSQLEITTEVLRDTLRIGNASPKCAWWMLAHLAAIQKLVRNVINESCAKLEQY